MLSQSREFEVNQYIILKLENRKTEIYVDNEKFIQCKYLMLNITKSRIEDYEELTSIDEISERLDKSLEKKEVLRFEISPEEEFWGHCSNLQVWVENNYDTCLIHSNLAFPLLKKLTQVGDPLAKKIFKEEIAKRFESGYIPVIRNLIYGGYLYFLNLEELECLLENQFDILLNSGDPLLLKKLKIDLNELGLDYYHSGRVKKAVKTFRMTVKFFPNDLELLENLANALRANKNFAKATSIYKKIINLDKNYSSAYIYLTMVYFEEKDYNNAIKVCKQSLCSNPLLYELNAIYGYLSDSYYNLGQYKEAKKYHRKFKKSRKQWKKWQKENELPW